PFKKPKIPGPSFGPTQNNKKVMQKAAALLEQRRQLPIWKGKESLKQAVKNNDTIVILGETGSGKTTQVPQFLYEGGFAEHGIIGITQPRKVAATSLATRVAAEQGTSLGQRVGYSVRFDDKSSEDTAIKYLTDGMLMRELLSDHLLSQYSVIIIDEAHERSLRTDLLLSSLKTIQKERNSPSTDATVEDPKGKQRQRDSVPLKVIIMSATLDAERFSKFFNDAKIFYVQGRQHAVKMYFSETPQEDITDSALQTLFQIHMQQPAGDVLVFLPGMPSRFHLTEHKNSIGNPVNVQICPLYAALPQHLQNRVFQTTPPNTRKIVLATNIAETSITIPGIKYVIDTGLCKEKQWVVAKNRGSGLEALVTKPISRSSAQQRAGRAGREGPGTCFRLFTEEAFKEMSEAALPEIQRCNLSFAVLQMKYLGQDPITADYMDRPRTENIKHSLQVLLHLEALTQKGTISPLGKSIAQFPLDPPQARSLLASKENNCTAETIIILSLLSTSGTVLLDPSSADMRDSVKDIRSKFRHSSGDHLTLLNIFRTYDEILQGTGAGTVAGKGGAYFAAKQWCEAHFINERALKEAKDISKQLASICEKQGLDPHSTCGDDTDRVLRTLLTGSYQYCAFLTPEGTYQQVYDRQPVKIFPSSTVFQRKAPAIMYSELVMTTAPYARTVSVVQPAWVVDLPAYRTRSA
ncbi:ATP-dependent RNA helicase Prh1, partial [Clavulina sp. PMI_390]